MISFHFSCFPWCSHSPSVHSFSLRSLSAEFVPSEHKDTLSGPAFDSPAHEHFKCIVLWVPWFFPCPGKAMLLFMVLILTPSPPINRLIDLSKIRKLRNSSIKTVFFLLAEKRASGRWWLCSWECVKFRWSHCRHFSCKLQSFSKLELLLFCPNCIPRQQVLTLFYTSGTALVSWPWAVSLGTFVVLCVY